MPQQTCILLLTSDQTFQNLVEQLFIIYGVRTLTAATVEEAEALIMQAGFAVLGLVIIDTAVLGPDELQQQQMSCQLLRDWTARYAGLPLLVVGSVLQRASLLPGYTDVVQFLAKPFRLHELVNATRRLWLSRKSLGVADAENTALASGRRR